MTHLWYDIGDSWNNDFLIRYFHNWMVLRLCVKVHVFAPNIDIDITFYWFEAGQKLVRLRSNRDRTTFAGRTTQILRIFRSIAIELLYSRRTTRPKVYNCLCVYLVNGREMISNVWFDRDRTRLHLSCFILRSKLHYRFNGEGDLGTIFPEENNQIACKRKN